MSRKPHHIRSNPSAVTSTSDSGRGEPKEFFCPSRVAVLVDADFYLRTYRRTMGRERAENPELAVDDLWHYCAFHVNRKKGERLYRIFVYDCPPLDKKWHHPLSGRLIDFSKSEQSIFRKRFHTLLVEQPFVALRRGQLTEPGYPWKIKEDLIKDVLAKKKRMEHLTENDVLYAPMQKGVDMKIGLDIAHLAHHRLVDKIVLISGDSDFVPAAKMARREGVHFVLDPINNAITPYLAEHIDQLTSKVQQLKTWVTRKSKEPIDWDL